MHYFKKIRNLVPSFIVALILSLGVSYVYAWVGPTATAPAANVAPPLNTGSVAQVKSGGIWAGSLGADGGVVAGGAIYSTVDNPQVYPQVSLRTWGLLGSGQIYIEPAAGSNLYLTDSWSNTGTLHSEFGKYEFLGGNVGIGVSGTSILGKLHVKGTSVFDQPGGAIRVLKTAGTASADDLGIWNRGGSGGRPFAIADWNTGTNGLFIDTTNGNVGIGTGAVVPSAKLQVSAGDSSFALFGPNTSWGGKLYVGAGPNQAVAQAAQVMSTDGNLHLDPAPNKNIYLGYYQPRDIYINSNGGNVSMGGNLSVAGTLTTGSLTNNGNLSVSGTLSAYKFTPSTGNSPNSGYDHYAIYEQPGTWSGTYPDLMIEYHTGISYVAYYGYGGHRFYTGYSPDASPTTLSFSIGEFDGNVRSYGNFYAPIMYDINNTGYYVDPASTSRLNYTVHDNIYSYGWIQGPYFLDSNDNAYSVSP
ncbi:hypothetical protein KW797_03900, partial [Candidatus Parcubacteria bacterium]|nr:hypothetical protein [Candidatus Parcubacteria bacterium]